MELWTSPNVDKKQKKVKRSVVFVSYPICEVRYDYFCPGEIPRLKEFGFRKNL